MTSIAHPARGKPSPLWLALPGTLAACFFLYLVISLLILELMVKFADSPQQLGRSVLAAPASGAILAVAAAPIAFYVSRRDGRIALAFMVLCAGLLVWSRL